MNDKNIPKDWFSYELGWNVPKAKGCKQWAAENLDDKTWSVLQTGVTNGVCIYSMITKNEEDLILMKLSLSL